MYYREEELQSYRGKEITDLMSRQQYLSPEEQERLKRLRLDHEFERRMAEHRSTGEEDDDDDIMESAAGRARMLRMMQQDAEKKRRESDLDRWEHLVE